MPQSLKNIFRLGKISHPNEKASQFSGKVTNINIVKEENNKLHDIANRICEQNVSLDLSWDEMRWEQIGGRNNSNIRNIDIDITEICTKANEEPVTQSRVCYKYFLNFNNIYIVSIVYILEKVWFGNS